MRTGARRSDGVNFPRIELPVAHARSAGRRSLLRAFRPVRPLRGNDRFRVRRLGPGNEIRFDRLSHEVGREHPLAQHLFTSLT